MSPSTKRKPICAEGKAMNVGTINAIVVKVMDFKLPEGVYSGEMKDGKRHGYGIMKWNSGFVDECYWKDDLQHELTMRVNQCGTVHWICSTTTGQNSFISCDSLSTSKFSSRYYPMTNARYKFGGNSDCLVNLANGWTLKVGLNFENNGGAMEGKGTVENKEGKVMFEGEWKDDKLQFGSPLYFIFWAAWFVRYPLWYMIVLSSILFSMYSLLSGAHNRLSHMQVSNSTLFSDGQPGAQYSGQLSYFRRHGQGVMRYYDYSSFGNATLMREYNGSWSQGVMSGPGTLTFSLDAPSQRGDVLSGDWVNNCLPHGVYKYVSGEVYTGDLANFERHGTGTMGYLDGSVYEGQFRRGNREGFGRLVDSELFVCEGKWFNDQFSDAEGCKKVKVIANNVVTSLAYQKVGKDVIIFFDRVQIPFVFVLIVAIFIPILLPFAIAMICC